MLFNSIAHFVSETPFEEWWFRFDFSTFLVRFILINYIFCCCASVFIWNAEIAAFYVTVAAAAAAIEANSSLVLFIVEPPPSATQGHPAPPTADHPPPTGTCVRHLRVPSTFSICLHSVCARVCMCVCVCVVGSSLVLSVDLPQLLALLSRASFDKFIR